MTQTGNINNTYGNSITVAVANTYMRNVLESSYLPKSALLIATEYANGEDVGHASLLVTDYAGKAAKLSSYIIEGSGLHSTNDAVYLNINNNTIKENNGKLSVNVENIIDSSSFYTSNKSISLDTQSLAKASNTTYGVAKVDNMTIKSNDGTIFVNTEGLDLANGQLQSGIARGDNSTISTTQGVLQAITSGLEKASSNAYGVAKVDGNIIKSNDGTIYVDKSYLKNITKDNKRLYVGDNQTIMSTDGILSFNEQSLPIASNTQAGVVKIDPNTIEINQDQSISIKGINETFAYVYDYEAGMDEIESKISYIRTTLDSGNLTGAEPEIRHLTCNQTTTSILAKPEYLEEPINMETQHVYVSLNVITNCKFVVEVIYDNNVVPNVELESINYNDEFTISGIDCLENVWPSTGMKEKTIVLLFNSKNFFSTTGPKTDVTKLSISVTSYDDNTKTKKVIYSIIRYNSFYKDDDMKDEPEQEFIEYSAEYVVDEKNSEWYIINVDETDEDSWNKNVLAFDKTASYVKKHGNLGGQDMVSTITVDNIEMIRRANEDEEHHKLELYLRGVYIEKKTGKSYSFLKPIPFDKFDTMTIESNEIYTLKGRGVYDYPFKVKFDTLYFQIRYQVDKKTRSILLGDIRDTIYTYHDGKTSTYIYVRNNADISPYYVSIDSGSKYWSTCNAYAFDDIHEVIPNYPYIMNSYLVLEPLQVNQLDINTIVATPTIDDNNDVIYGYGGITYATIHIDDCLNFSYFGGEDKKNTKLVIDTDFDNFDIGRATMVFVNPDVIIGFDPSNLSSLENENIVTSFGISVKNMRYDTCTYLYCGEEHLTYFTYGQEMPDICYYSSLLYSANYENFKTVPQSNNEDLSYMMINLVSGDTKLYDNTFKPINESYVINGNYDSIANQQQYRYSISYNLSYNGDEKYWETDKANELVINTYSYPRVLLSGLFIDLDNKIQIKKDDDIDVTVNNVGRIQDRDPFYTSYFAYYILLSYMVNSNTQIQELNPILLTNNDIAIQVDSNYLSQDYRLKIGEVVGNHASTINEIPLGNYTSNTFNFVSDRYFKHLYAYVYKTDNTAFSDIITVFKCEQPLQNTNLIKLSYNYFDYTKQEDKIYSYYTINELENYQTCFSDNSYIRPNTYVTIENDVKCILSYDPHPIERSIANISMIYGHIIVDINDEGYENENIGYANIDKFAIKIGKLYDGDESELQSQVSAYIMTYIGNAESGNFKEHQLAISNVYGDIIAHDAPVEYIERASEIFLNINTLPKYGGSAYNVFNSAVWRLNYVDDDDDKFLVINNNNYYDYLLTYVFASMNNVDLNDLYLNTNENYYLKLYDNENNCKTFQLDNLHNILVDGDTLNLDQDHYVCQAMLSYQNINQEYSSGSLGYTYNVPNLFNIYNECSLEVYSDFIVPRFNRPFNAYFTPYDFSVEANIPDNDTDYLNKRVSTNVSYVTFNLKYKGNVFKTYTIDTSDLNVDLSNITYIQREFNATHDIISYAYISYSPIYSYAYSQIQSYIDTSIIHLYDGVIEQKEYYCKLSDIDDLDINDSIDILGENEQFNDVNIYLVNPNTMAWKLNDFNNIDNSTVYEFNLVKTSTIDYEHDIYPQLNPNYPIITNDMIEDFLVNNYDLEDSDPIGSGSSN